MGEAKRREPHKPPRLPFDSLAEAWLLWTSHAHPNATPEVREVLRTTFYMGASAFFDLTMHRMDPGEEPTEADMKRMDRLHEELQVVVRQKRAQARQSPPGTTPH